MLGQGSRSQRGRHDDYDRRSRRDDGHPRRARTRRSSSASPSRSNHSTRRPYRTRSPPAAVRRSPGASPPRPEAPPEKQAPNYNPTGLLAAETNTVAGVVLKYNEPPEARKPSPRDDWRLYVFKGSDLLETVELGGRSCWLVGRERVVVDFPVDHPSCSKQHAVIQFRYVVKTNEYGDKDGKVR